MLWDNNAQELFEEDYSTPDIFDGWCTVLVCLSMVNKQILNNINERLKYRLFEDGVRIELAKDAQTYPLCITENLKHLVDVGEIDYLEYIKLISEIESNNMLLIDIPNDMEFTQILEDKDCNFSKGVYLLAEY